MIALILAGGKGTRLRPHTEEIPKPLLKLNNSTILGNQIENLTSLGVTKIIIVTGFLSEKIHAYVEENYPHAGIAFVHNAEFEHSKPAYGIISALNHLDDDTLYLNGDVLFERQILKAIIESELENITAIQKTAWDEEEVNVVIKNGIIDQLSKNLSEGESDGEFIGITKLSKKFIESIKEIVTIEGKEVFRYFFAIDLINHTLHQKNQVLYPLDVTHLHAIEIDTNEDYKDAQIKIDQIENEKHN